MKTILVPVDFSACSMSAAHLALTLASKSGAGLIYLHLHPQKSQKRHVPPAGIEKESQEEKKAVGRIRAQLELLIKKAESAGVKAKQVLALTSDDDWIENYIAPYRVDLVVMGTHSSKKVSGKLGSTTLKFIRKAAVPVLVVKKRIMNFAPRQIVFASDFRTDWIKPFRAALDLVDTWKASLHLLYVCTPYHFVSTRVVKANIRRFLHQFRGIKCTTHVYNALDEESGIQEFVEDNNFDLIALTTHGRTGASHLFHHSIAEETIKHTDKPVLVINIKKFL